MGISFIIIGSLVEEGETTPKLAEQPIYGLGRVGAINYDGTTTPPQGLSLTDVKLAMRYELSDHIGNVRTVFGVQDLGGQLTQAVYYAG